MKCDNCGKNEVSFVYQSNINGKVTQVHLCSECAEKLGYTQRITAQNQRMMQGFLGGFLEPFFSPTPQLSGGMDRFFGEDPFDDFFSEMPALRAPAEEDGPNREPENEPGDDLVGREEQSEFSRIRQLNALKIELQTAIQEENFERAAQLRDQIRAMEAKPQNPGEIR